MMSSISRTDYRNLIRIIILGILILYFVTKVVNSVNKLHEAKIGTLFRKITDDTVEGGGHCYCIEMHHRKLNNGPNERQRQMQPTLPFIPFLV